MKEQKTLQQTIDEHRTELIKIASQFESKLFKMTGTKAFAFVDISTSIIKVRLPEAKSWMSIQIDLTKRYGEEMLTFIALGVPTTLRDGEDDIAIRTLALMTDIMRDEKVKRLAMNTIKEITRKHDEFCNRFLK